MIGRNKYVAKESQTTSSPIIEIVFHSGLSSDYKYPS